MMGSQRANTLLTIASFTSEMWSCHWRQRVVWRTTCILLNVLPRILRHFHCRETANCATGINIYASCPFR